METRICSLLTIFLVRSLSWSLKHSLLAFYGKEFVSQKVDILLSASLSRKSTQSVLEKETKVLLSQPATYPVGLFPSPDGECSTQLVSPVKRDE